jgi:hypothetical protein
VVESVEEVELVVGEVIDVVEVVVVGEVLLDVVDDVDEVVALEEVVEDDDDDEVVVDCWQPQAADVIVAPGVSEYTVKVTVVESDSDPGRSTLAEVDTPKPIFIVLPDAG